MLTEAVASADAAQNIEELADEAAGWMGLEKGVGGPRQALPERSSTGASDGGIS
jgi:hypothetical protein